LDIIGMNLGQRRLPLLKRIRAMQGPIGDDERRPD
jgi:hypothetical protein